MNIRYLGHLEKLTWQQARQSVAAVNPEFAKIIDEINPNKTHSLYKVRYPYGAYVLNKSKLMLPNDTGQLVPIGDESLNPEINKDLSYNMNSNPVSLILKNSFEIFLPMADRTLPFSGIMPPGLAFGAWRVLNPQTTEHPAFMWDMTAGARSVFMLPKVTENLKHKKLIKEFGIDANVPKSLMQHWEVFRQLANSDLATSDPWSAEILFFGEKWFTHLKDKAWQNFYHFFHQSTWTSTEFWRNKPFWDLVFSLIIESYEARPNAYIMDTTKYLLYMAVGALPGLGPVQNTLSGPFDLIQDVYKNIYEIRKYLPIIMQPQVFNMREKSSPPVYYSMQFPHALEFKPSTRARVSVVSDLHEIRSLLNRYARDLRSEQLNVIGTSFYDLFNLAQFDYFHTGVDLHIGMRDSCEMAEDSYLRTTINGDTSEAYPNTCLFGKGCVRISKA